MDGGLLVLQPLVQITAAFLNSFTGSFAQMQAALGIQKIPYILERVLKGIYIKLYHTFGIFSRLTHKCTKKSYLSTQISGFLLSISLIIPFIYPLKYFSAYLKEGKLGEGTDSERLEGRTPLAVTS